jgi:FkbH-like protein
VGEALVDFQQGVKALTRRGVVLGIVSKNTESVAVEAIRSHPAMVLKLEDFVGWRINWQDKAANIAALAAELRLGLQSTVFIDDNPVERARVREALPEVLVPEWPEDKLAYPAALAALRCFDSPAVSREDQERGAMYAAEREREAARESVGSLDDWLATLGITVRAERVGPASVTRTTQLLNKTNQMNLTTRRLTEGEVVQWAAAPGHAMWAITVSDRFGDAGLTGVLGIEREADTVRVVDFVLSCRVMGRKVEETMTHLAVAHARAEGARRVEARLIPTAKNQPCRDFWSGSGWSADESGDLYAWDASAEYPRPAAVTLTGDV